MYLLSMGDAILNKLRGIFPEAPRVTRSEAKVGDAVWDIVYRVCGVPIVYETRRGVSNELGTFGMTGEEQIHRLKGMDWDAVKLTHLSGWARSGLHVAGFLHSWGWDASSPSQEGVLAIKERFCRLQRVLSSGGALVSLRQTSVDDIVEASFTAPSAGRILYILINEAPYRHCEAPYAHVSMFGGPVEKVPMVELDVLLEALPDKILSVASSTTNGLAFLGKRPWQNWVLDGVETNFSQVDECLSTAVKIDFTADFAPTQATSFAWLRENLRAVTERLPDEVPFYRGSLHVAAAAGVQFLSALDVVESASADEITLHRPDGRWQLLVERSSRLVNILLP